MDELQKLREFRAEEAGAPAKLDRAHAALIEEIEGVGTSAGERRSRDAEQRVVERRRLSERFRTAPPRRAEPFARRWALLAGATLLLALGFAVAVLPSDSGGPNQAQAALRRVALIAGGLPAESAPKRGQYLYTKSVRLIGPELGTSPYGDRFEDSRATFDEGLARAGVAKYTVQLWAGTGDGAYPGRRITDRDGILPLKGIPIDPQARQELWERKLPIVQCGWPYGVRGCESGPHGQIYDPFGNRHSDIETEIGLIPPGPLPGEIYNDLSRLPSHSGALRDRLLKRAGAARVERSGSTVVTFDIAADLLSTPGNYASPEVRQALYEAVADLPDVKLVGEVKDPLGRRGLAVGLTNNGIERQLIFDPNTSELLAREDVVADPEELGLDAKPGAVLSYTAYLVSGVADSLREKPSVNYLDDARQEQG
jgi:hypothetical protein